MFDPVSVTVTIMVNWIQHRSLIVITRLTGIKAHFSTFGLNDDCHWWRNSYSAHGTFSDEEGVDGLEKKDANGFARREEGCEAGVFNPGRGGSGGLGGSPDRGGSGSDSL